MSALLIYLPGAAASQEWNPTSHWRIVFLPIALSAIISMCAVLYVSEMQCFWMIPECMADEVFWKNIAMLLNFIVPLQIPIAVGVLVGIILSRCLGLKMSLAGINLRLWRIIAGIALLTAVNYGMLWLEKQPWAAELLK